MHSVIIQVGVEPIPKENYINEGSYYEHWFTREIADYVDELLDGDRLKVIKKMDRFDGIQVSRDEGGEFIVLTDKEKFFARPYERFKNSLKTLGTIQLSDFATDGASIGCWMHLLNEAYNDKRDVYIVTSDDTFTISEFVRLHKCGKYYIGGVLNYHA